MKNIKYVLVVLSLAGLAVSCNKQKENKPNPVPAKSEITAEQLAQRYLDSYKYGDYKAAYSYTCLSFKSQVSEDKFVSFWNQEIDSKKDQNYYYKDFQLKEIITENGSTKARFVAIVSNPLINKDVEMASQFFMTNSNGEWCTEPPDEQFK